MAHKIIQWNCRGLKPNINELHLQIATLCPALLCLQETFLKQNDNINIKNYEQYNYTHDTGNRASGGTSILIRNDIPQSKINLDTKLQTIAIKATLHRTINICSLYIPPHDPINEKELNKLIQQLPRPFILMGDFNSHNIIWGSKDTNQRGRKIEKIINNNNLYLLNNKTQTYLSPASGTYSAIDLTICDPTTALDYNWRVQEEPHGSDHFPIILEHLNTKPEDKTPGWNLHKADWEKFKKSCLTKLNPASSTNQEDHITHFTNTLITIAEECIPKYPTTTKNNKPWYNRECKEAIRTRRTALRKFNKNPTTVNLTNYKNYRAKARRKIKEAKRTSWKNFVTKLNTNTKIKTVWNMIRKITGKYNNTPIKHLTKNNIKVTSKKDIANLLAETFAQNSSQKNQNPTFQTRKQKEEKKKINLQSQNNENYNQLFSMTELKEAVTKAHNTAVGPDEIHYEFLKKLPNSSKNYLLKIFNDIWVSGEVPALWKCATVIPVPKPAKDHSDHPSTHKPKDNTSNPLNYRPIALTSCICKTLERMINNRLIWHLETNQLITKYQSGFRNKRSTMDHLVCLETYIREAFIRK